MSASFCSWALGLTSLTDGHSAPLLRVGPVLGPLLCPVPAPSTEPSKGAGREERLSDQSRHASQVPSPALGGLPLHNLVVSCFRVSGHLVLS